MYILSIGILLASGNILPNLPRSWWRSSTNWSVRNLGCRSCLRWYHRHGKHFPRWSLAIIGLMRTCNMSATTFVVVSTWEYLLSLWIWSPANFRFFDGSKWPRGCCCLVPTYPKPNLGHNVIYSIPNLVVFGFFEKITIIWRNRNGMWKPVIWS